jgi:ATP-dependent DNA ligase
MANKGKAKKPENLDESKLKLFTPIEIMKPVFWGKGSEEICERVIGEQNGSTYAEIKEDGFRLQLHKKGDRIEGFSSSLGGLDMRQFPEVKLGKLPDCILECEITGDEPGVTGFEKVFSRGIKFGAVAKGLDEYLGSEKVVNNNIKLRVFDTLYWHDKFLVNRPLMERRTFTECINESGIEPSKLQIVNSSADLWTLYNRVINNADEGLVCKDSSSIYIPGDRKEWVKVKRFETLDLAILGVFLKEGRIVEILGGTFNNGRYETLAKVNAKTGGLYEIIEKKLKKNYVKNVPVNVIMNPKVSVGGHDWPTYFIKPKNTMVVQVGVMNFYYKKNCYSCGLKDGNAFSVRNPVLERVREDKKPEMATSTDKIRGFYFAERGLKG